MWNALTVGEDNEALTNAAVACRSYTITFDVNGVTTDTNVAINKVPAFQGRPVKEHEDPNKFYVFAGWTDGTATYAAGEALPKATKDVTYTALFTENSEERLVTGTIGTVTWVFDKMTGVLTVSGTGSTPNWTNDSKKNTEWHVYADQIAKVVIAEGITTIGSYSFSGLTALEEVVLSSTVKTLSADAFSYNSALKTLHLPASLTTIGQGVLYSANGVSTVYYAGCAHQWATLVAGITAAYNDNVKNASPIFAKTSSYETTDETHTLVCAGCNKSEVSEEHSFGEITEIKANVYHGGSKYHSCSVCGKTVVLESSEQITAIGGDIDMDGNVNISDITVLLNYLSMSADEQSALIEDQLIHAEAVLKPLTESEA